MFTGQINPAFRLTQLSGTTPWDEVSVFHMLHKDCSSRGGGDFLAPRGLPQHIL